MSKEPKNIRSALCCRKCVHFIACVNEYRDSHCRLVDVHVSPFDVCDDFHKRATNTDGYEFVAEPMDE